VPSTDRVRRPLGLTIAILAIAVWYGVLPLLRLYFMQRVGATAEESYVPGGIDITTWDWLEGLIGGGMLILCILAWWGRPPWIRIVLMSAMLVLTVFFLYRILQAAVSKVDPIFGGQVQSDIRRLLLCQLPAMILVPPYGVWYLNRAPARAFYRRVPLAQMTQRQDGAAPADGNRQQDTIVQ
jgi:hypothetical protein